MSIDLPPNEEQLARQTLEKESNEVKASDLMIDAFVKLKMSETSRENSIALTKIEEAMMWNNKDRVVKGHLEPSKTHIQ